MLRYAVGLCLVLWIVVACSSGGSGSTAGSVAPAAPAAPAGALAPAPAKDAASGAPAVNEAAPASQAVPLDRMIVRQGNLSITVKDPVAGVQGITTIVERVNGYVASTDYRNSGDEQTTTVSIRIPSQEYANVLRDIRGLALKVNQETTTSQDVTEQYTDLSAQLHNLQATEAQYLALMAKAQSVDDIIKVQQRLTEVQGQIERLQGQINFLQRKSDFSQLDITLVPEAQQAQDPKVRSRFVTAVETGWEASLTAISVIVYLVVLLWWVIPVALIGFGIARFLNRRRPRPIATPPKPPEMTPGPDLAAVP
jgi:hypothetical protein